MNSKHLTGDAVDLMAFISGRGSWEINLYDEIADAMREGGEKVGINLRWGAAWHKPLTGWNGTAEALMNEYIDLRRSQGKRPFLDCPHFERLD
jgi:peptidoglycan LD-endopeptidase CwlK